MFRPVGREEVCPLAMRGRAARADPGREMFAHTVGNQELRILGPTVRSLREADLLLAERFAVGGRRVLFVRRAVTDVAIEDDQSRAPLRLPEDTEERAG